MSEAGAIGGPFCERKVKPDGSVREYRCTLVRAEAGMVVVEFLMARGGAIAGTPIEVPPGSISHGYFWRRRPYSVYRMRRADGEVFAHRFDAVTGVRFEPAAVTYRDLALDWWALPDGTIIEEDRDEFEAFVHAGVLSPSDARRALDAAQQVYSRYRHIINELAAFERKVEAGALLRPERA